MLFNITTIGHAETLRYDGNLWRQLNEEQQGMYMFGFIAGLEFQRRTTIRSFVENGYSKEDTEKYFSLSNTRSEYLLKNANSRQIADGLKIFYEDFKNRSIKIKDAIIIVCLQIQGEKTDVINSEINFLRSTTD
jgi:hypothetical protein